MTWKCCQDFSPSIVLNKIDLNILVLFSLVFADKCFERLQRNVSVVIRLIVPVEVLWHLTGSLDLCSQWAWSRVLCLMPLILMVALMHSLSISLKPSWKFWLWSTSITPPLPQKIRFPLSDHPENDDKLFVTCAACWLYHEMFTCRSLTNSAV